MIANAVSSDSIASGNQSSRSSAPKSYRAPTLVKGATLSAITAEPALSGGGISTDNLN
jgi:hypothetical protein